MSFGIIVCTILFFFERVSESIKGLVLQPSDAKVMLYRSS